MPTLSHSSDTIVKLNSRLEELFGAQPTTALTRNSPAFDISKRNIHDTKSEFMKEYQTTSSIIKHLRGILDQLIEPKFTDDAKHSAMTKRLEKTVDEIASRTTARSLPRGADELLQLNMAQSGFYANSLNTIKAMLNNYHEHLEVLEAQKSEFWSAANRSRNHYTYDIACRFAHYYYDKKGEMPTFGISSQGAHPSTDFGRALEDVFKILGINSHIRGPAEAAIGELKGFDPKVISE
jgi:hypothetical protein